VDELLNYPRGALKADVGRAGVGAEVTLRLAHSSEGPPARGKTSGHAGRRGRL